MRDREQQLVEARRLSAMLIRTAERSKSDFARTVAPFGLPVQLARAILLLDHPAPMRELADHLECDRSYVTGLADQLEERGLVTRVPGHDRRVKLLSLTRSGRQLRDKISAAVAKESLVMRMLDDDGRRALGPLLERLLSGEADAGAAQPPNPISLPSGSR